MAERFKYTEATIKPKSYNRLPVRESRINRRSLAVATAAEAIGPIKRGCEIFGVNGGQFSIVDMIDHCLQATGPADLVISTWTAAAADLTFVLNLMDSGVIRKVRFVMDFSYPSRHPEYCAAMRELFGDSAIRITKNHAKFYLIENDDWHIAIRSSMNLNENRRLEAFEISDDSSMTAYIHELLDRLWVDHADGEQFEHGPYQVEKGFEDFASDGGQVKEVGPQYIGDGQIDTDMRRIGITTEKGGSIK